MREEPHPLSLLQEERINLLHVRGINAIRTPNTSQAMFISLCHAIWTHTRKYSEHVHVLTLPLSQNIYHYEDSARSPSPNSCEDRYRTNADCVSEEWTAHLKAALAIRVSIDRAADSHLVLTYSVSWSTVKQLKCFSSNVNSKSLNAIHAHFRIYGATLFISYLITLIKYTQGNP